MKTRLVLLTNEFPFLGGDTNFIRNEIEALASGFDEVVVFNYAREPARGLVELPSSVSYGGNLYEVSRWQTLRALLSLSALAVSFRVLATELRADALRGHVKTFLLAVLVGMRLARYPALRSAFAQSATRTSVYSFWGMGAALCLPWLPQVMGARVVRLHRYDLYEEESGYLPFRCSLFNAVDRVLAISLDARTYLLERYSDAHLNQKVIVNRLGTFSAERPMRPPRSKVRTIVSCSSVTSVKRVARILDALQLLRHDELIRWFHFGGGPLEQKLRERADAATFAGIEIMLRGTTDNAEILRFYAENRIDLFLNVSSSEGVPVSIMEAMSFGVPIIATAVGGTSEIVSPALGSGELIDADFSDGELAAVIEHVLGASDSSYSSRAVWEALCDASRNSAELVHLLEDAPTRSRSDD